MGLLSTANSGTAIFGCRPSTRTAGGRYASPQIDETLLLFQETVRENLQFFGGIWGMDAPSLRSRISGISEKLSVSEFLDEPFAQLSSGMKQRVSIARSLLHDPPLLLLDEPTRSLDVVAQEELRTLLGSGVFENKTVLLATHKFEEAVRLSGRCVVLNRGRLVLDGAPPASESALVELLGKEEP